jgi:hypothetical protein
MKEVNVGAKPECISNDGNESVFTGLFYETADSTNLCADCLVPYWTAFIEQNTGVPVIEFMAAMLAGQAASEPEGEEVEVQTHFEVFADGKHNDELPELTEDDIGFAAWVEVNQPQIDMLVADGSTFDDAVATLLAQQLDINSADAEDTPPTEAQ